MELILDLHIRSKYSRGTSSLSNDQRFKGMIEFFPEEGKYHYDGHRACKVCLSTVEPGYDGVFGIIKVFSDKERMVRKK